MSTEFFSTLFSPQDATCFARDKKDTAVYPLLAHGQSRIDAGAVFFCINALHPDKDLCPAETYHNVHRPRRADGNVISFRNFLVEFDTIPLDQQEEYVAELGLPYTTAVYSGGKSIHYIISLQESLLDLEEYRKLVKRIHIAVGESKIDKSCKNPSRLSRIPGVLRSDTGKIQELLFIGSCISRSDLEEWLLSRGVAEKNEKTRSIANTNKRVHAEYYKQDQKHEMSRRTRMYLESGAEAGHRNDALFLATCDLARAGWQIDQILDEVLPISGLPEQETGRTVRSAYARALSDLKKANDINA